MLLWTISPDSREHLIRVISTALDVTGLARIELADDGTFAVTDIESREIHATNQRIKGVTCHAIFGFKPTEEDSETLVKQLRAALSWQNWLLIERSEEAEENTTWIFTSPTEN
ncbi:MAG: hypothetical protein Q4P71_09005 [Actinomycetaceae bacterium]|nr:hypothetical protein [Actinomycetaceae bacterium]